MKKTRLGEFQELVLLVVIDLQDEAYGVTIKEQLESRLNERVTVGAIQSALKRLEEKGFLQSHFGEATPVRGGRRKRIYQATPYAFKVLQNIRAIREGLWASISLNYGLGSP